MIETDLLVHPYDNVEFFVVLSNNKYSNDHDIDLEEVAPYPVKATIPNFQLFREHAQPAYMYVIVRCSKWFDAVQWMIARSAYD